MRKGEIAMVIKRKFQAILQWLINLIHFNCSVKPITTVLKFQDKIEKRDINEDGSIQNRLISTFHFPLSDMTYFPEIPTVAIEGDGFQRVEIRIPADLFLEMAEKVKEFMKQ